MDDDSRRGKTGGEEAAMTRGGVRRKRRKEAKLRKKRLDRFGERLDERLDHLVLGAGLILCLAVIAQETARQLKDRKRGG